MRVRHRIPSIFSLSMVDVLCCALGCVILLWLLNLREAKEHDDEAAAERLQTSTLLAEARTERDRVGALLDEARADSADAYGLAAALGQELDGVRKRLAEREDAARVLARDLEVSRRRLAELDRDLRASRKRYDDEAARSADLARKLQATDTTLKGAQATADLVPGLRNDLKAVQDRYADEEARLHKLEKELAQRLTDLKDVNRTLDVLRAAKQAAERDLDTRDKELSEARSFKAKWTSAQERVLALEKDLEGRRRELAEANRSISALEDDKKSLRAEVGRVKSAADNRFAGIAPTGQRVVFLVDMSGSMKLIDEDTPAPDKWPAVRNTVVRLMRSLPELEKYQVIVFSEKASYLLGGAGRWVDYDPSTSPARVLKALSAIEPDGGTNIHAGLELAFRMRDKGLDTIYFLSDGLPDRGEGLSAERAFTSREIEILTKYIRRKLKTTWNRPRVEAPRRVRINTLGFFYESPDVGAFLWALARENDGGFVGMSRP